MQKIEDITNSVPRVFSCINLGYLFEAAKVADEQFSKKIEIATNSGDSNLIGNINATRQMLLRSVFIASYAILEQNLDEIVGMRQKKLKITISPADLKDNGITRSINYAKKVLGYNIDINQQHWVELFAIQKVRNHLVHYGENFDDSEEHTKRILKFNNSKYVTLRPEICFTLNQIEKVFGLYINCVNEFILNE